MDAIVQNNRKLGGLDERRIADAASCTRLVNVTRDRRTGGWSSRIGYEKFDPLPDVLYAPWATSGKCDALYVWDRHGGAQQWILWESGGTLSYVQDFAGAAGTAVTLRTIQSGRTAPAPGEPGTSFCPFGRDLVVLNGYDAPLRFRGWPVMQNNPSVPVYPLGWANVPAAPFAWGVDVAPPATSGKSVSIVADGSTEYGLGSATDGALNTYRWKVAFRTDTGSTSPVSAASNTVQWVTPAAGTYQGKRWVAYLEVPLGPDGTVARDIYRTKNLGSTDGELADEVYYYCGTIPNNAEKGYYDHWSDAQLASEAPGADDSVVLGPRAACRFAAEYDGCLWLSGNSSSGGRLWKSVAGRIDQFRALDVYDVASRDSGEVTGLFATRNYLLVLRERGIDMLRRSSSASGYEVWPLLGGAGCISPRAIAQVPQIGVIYMGADAAFYLISGAVDGGGTLSVTPISDELCGTLERANVSLLSRAVACYSPFWREFQCHFPADGSDRNNLGVVLHTDVGAWSTREGWPVGALAVTLEGDILFGHTEGYTSTARVPSGIFVQVPRQCAGHTVVQDGQDYTTIYADPLTSTIRSAWLAPGDAAQKLTPLYVDLHIETMGNPTLALVVYRDGNYTGVTHPEVVQQRADHIDQQVYGTMVLGSGVGEAPMPAVLRIAVHPGDAEGTGQTGGAASMLAWEVSTDAPFLITGYSFAYQPKDWTLPAARRPQ